MPDAEQVQAVRALNVEVAARVMGWTQWDIETGEDCPCEPGVTYFADWGEPWGLGVYLPEGDGDVSFYFNPAGDEKDALRVADKLKADDFWPSMTWKSGIVPGDINRAVWFVRFRCVRGGTRGDHWAYDESLPLAICKASLEVINRAD